MQPLHAACIYGEPSDQRLIETFIYEGVCGGAWGESESMHVFVGGWVCVSMHGGR